MQRWDNGLQKLSEYSRHWRFLLEAELVAERLGRVGSIGKETALLDRIGDWLWSPLEIRSAAKQVLVLPDGELANLPWLGIRSGGRPLVESHSIVQAPSLRHFLRTRENSRKSSKVRIFAGVSHDLPAVREELHCLSAVAGPDTVVYDPCRRENWPKKGDFLLWHYAGHANLRAENPFYSYISLDDGPLFAADFRLRQANVNLVTLAACRSGQQVAPPGEEHTGLVRSLLEMGARNVIAGHWPVADRSTALWMSAFYNMFFGNQPIQSAMRHATLTVREKYPSAYHWAAYSVFGAGK
jgi:CHAT domain-containing protein